MNKSFKNIIIWVFYFLLCPVIAQNDSDLDLSKEISPLFLKQEILPVKLSYSNKLIKKETNDSTYKKSVISYKLADGNWQDLEIEFRARGNFRLKNCHVAPLKVKINKKKAKGTLFEGNKKLKVVLPCMLRNSSNNKVIKEYMAYKFFKIISPYHFNTRIVQIDYKEIKGDKIKNHDFIGFLIEDDKNIAKRFKGKVLDRSIHPYAQDTIASIRNAFFQFMIGNTDFSVNHGHNEKLLFIDNKIIPVPYDFDMSGLVNASYSAVSQTQGVQLPITSVTQRLYRGFKRQTKYYQQVRQEFIDKKNEVFSVFDKYESFFNNPKEFRKSKEFIEDFYKILESDKKFESEIIDVARKK